ncbi:MAG: glycosyltransferase [Chitinophagaceae bacterium]
MNGSFSEKKGEKPRILVAPLDWGLGHATRCIPVIRELLEQGADPWLAGEGAQEELLRTEFPGLPFLQLPGYRVRYTKTGRGLAWKMIQQGPGLKRAIRYEQEWLKKIVDQYRFDAVISDNRYGLYHARIPSVFITHQLYIKSSWGKWTERILQKRNYNYINKFSECWVPDLAGDNNLAGALSHPLKKPTTSLKYIGLLSRFSGQDNGNTARKAHLLVVLSGPEPQRSILEEKIINGITTYEGTATIVRGLPESKSVIPSTNMIRVYNHLPSPELNAAMLQAEWVIGRSGYSTIMDIISLAKKSILVPTPGQTEQEYLGNYLMEKGKCFCLQQENFSLVSALEKAAAFKYLLTPVQKNKDLKNVLSSFLQSITPALG